MVQVHPAGLDCVKPYVYVPRNGGAQLSEKILNFEVAEADVSASVASSKTTATRAVSTQQWCQPAKAITATA